MKSAPFLWALASFALLASALTGPALVGRGALGPDKVLDWDPLYRTGTAPQRPRQGDFTPIVIDYPRDLAVARAFSAGRIDNWNPLSGCGAPLWAEQGGPFFPLKLPFYVAPSRTTYNLFLALRLVFAALGAYFLARAGGLSVLPAIAAGATFQLSMALIAQLPFGAASPTYVLPWVVLGAVAIARRPGLRSTAAAGLALGLAGSGGHPTLALLDFLAFAAAIAGHAASAWREPRRVAELGTWSAGAVVLGLALAAPTLLPLAELSTMGSTYKHRAVGANTRSEMLRYARFFFPVALFAPRNIGYFYRHSSSLLPFAPAIGIIAVVAAAGGLTRRWLDAGLVAILVLGVALALDPPVLGWIARLPGVSLILPTYAGVLIALVLTQAAGRGVQATATPAERATLPLGLALVFGTCLLLSLFGIVFFADLAVFAALLRQGTTANPHQFLIPAAIGAAAVLACRALQGSRFARAAAPALLLAMLADQAVTILPYVREPRAEMLSSPPSPAVQELRRRIAANGGRILGLPFLTGYPLTPMFFSLPDFRGVSALPVRRFYEYVEAISPGASAFTTQGVEVAASPLLDLAAVRYVVVARSDDRSVPHRRLLVPPAVPDPNDPHVRLAYRDARVEVYENGAALPRARIVRDVVRVAGEEESLAWLRAAAEGSRHASDGILSSRLALEPDAHGITPPESTGSPLPTDRVRIVDDADPDRLRLEATLQEPGFVVIADTYYPGWNALIDGEPTAIYPANLLFRAVHVPAGTHRIELAYQPRPFRAGVALFTVAALACVAVLVWSGRGRPPASPHPPASASLR